MEFSKSIKKHGPINIYEDNFHYFVQIHPQNRERAKKIEGRNWDNFKKVWVYPKNIDCYNALLQEFKNDADSIKINPPREVGNVIQLSAPKHESESDAEIELDLSTILSNIIKIRADLKFRKIIQPMIDEEIPKYTHELRKEIEGSINNKMLFSLKSSLVEYFELKRDEIISNEDDSILNIENTYYQKVEKRCANLDSFTDSVFSLFQRRAITKASNIIQDSIKNNLELDLPNEFNQFFSKN
jgi:hypothetical protein